MAILFSLFRALTPWVKQYKGDIEQHLSVLLGQPVTISTMETSWYWFEPVLKLDQVSIADAQHQVLKLNKLLVGINLLSSLWHWQLQPGILYVGDVHLTLRQGIDHWEIDGLRQDKQTTTLNSESYLPILGWVLSQDRIIIKNASALIYLKDGSVLPVNKFHLSAVNHYGHYRLKGGAELAHETPTKLSILADLQITPSALNKSKGRIYLSVENFVPAQWQTFFPEKDYRIESGAGDIEFWFDLAKGRLKGLQTKFNFDNVVWIQSGKPRSHAIQSLQANLAWKPTADGWQVSGDNIKFSASDRSWPENKLMLDYIKSQQAYRLFVEKLWLQPFLALDLEWPEQMKPILAAHPQGELYDSQLEIKDNQVDLVLTRFANLSWKRVKDIPAVSDLSGVLYWHPTAGRLEFNGENTVITPQKMPAVKFEQINGAFDWQSLSQGLRISMERLVLDNADLTLSASGSLDEALSPAGGHLQLAADFSAKEALQWFAYLPVKYIKPKLYDWLQHDIKRIGNIAGKVTVNGLLADFPFDKQPGEFNITSNISGLDFLINEHWPLTRDVDANLRLDKRSLQFDILHSDLLGIIIDNAHLRIDDLGLDRETLLLHAKVMAPAEKTKAYILATPLASHLSRLSMLDMQGDLGVDVRLEVPLYSENDDVLARGTIAFNNNLLTIHHAVTDIELRNLSGMLDFDEHGVTDSALTAVLLDDPVSMHVQSFSKPHPYTEVRVEGNTTINLLKTKLNLPIFTFMEGHLQIETILTITDDPNDLDHISVNTSLHDVAIDLPAPLGKALSIKEPLKIHVDFNPKKGFRIRANYGNRLSSDLWFASTNKTYLLQKGQIRLGKGQAADQNVAGVQIVGSLPGLEIQQWQKVMARLPADVSSLNLFDNVKLVDIIFGSISVLNHNYTQVGIKARKIAKDDWQIAINQKAIDASLRYQLADNIVGGNFKRLSIPKTVLTNKDNNSTLSKLNPSQIPNLNITVDDFKVGEIDMGSVVLKSTSTSTNWRLENCNINSPDYQLTLKGDWTKNDKQNRTNLQASLIIVNLQKSLQRWNISPVVEARKGDIQFEGGWQGAMSDFSMKTVNGDMSITFKDGRITNLSRETEEKLGLGKLLSILSLQTIPRRLKLDFSDLAEGGYSFDKFKGNFVLKNGVMTTSDSSIDGPVAYASMKGDLDLVKHLYNLELFVSPHITASLPIVATIAGGPIAGIATWVASKIINSGMQKISGYTYKVSGPWLDPVVQQVSIFKKETPNPP